MKTLPCLMSPLRRNLLKKLFIAGATLTTYSRGMASKPALPPHTFREKVQLSTYVVLGQIDRVDFVASTSTGEHRVLQHIPTFPERAQGVLSVTTLEKLKWPQREAAADHLKVIYFEGSTYKQFVERFTVGTRWILYLIPSEGYLKSDPPEFYGSFLICRVPLHGRSVLPDPEQHLAEVRLVLQELDQRTK